MSTEHVESEASIRLSVQHVAKAYVTYGLWPLVRRNQVLVDASLEVPAKEVVALVGANGSGKSTLMMIIAGALSRDAGTVHINGRIGYCPQYPVLYEKLTIAETFRLFGIAYGMAPEEVEKSASSLMADLDFAGYRDYRVEHLSGGTKQKLNLALALLHDPELLLLDEPYSGFDYETYLRFWDMSKEMAKRGRGILVISHFVQERNRLDRIYHLKEGRCERER
jgi:ABC-type multidrug transport system ATPase subunit